MPASPHSDRDHDGPAMSRPPRRLRPTHGLALALLIVAALAIVRAIPPVLIWPAAAGLAVLAVVSVIQGRAGKARGE